MSRALETIEECGILRAAPKLTAKLGAFSYSIDREGNQSIYTVGNGSETIRVPLAWAFGLGAAGQTYLFQRNGEWYESRVSYYSALKGLDLTMGALTAEPRTLEEAAGRLTSASDAGLCFNCHATNAVKGTRLTLAAMTPGVQCERCHGDSAAHLQTPPTPMKKLGALTTEETSDFCGQCHRTWSQIAMTGPRGILNVRFQPYRLANSKCYSSDDDRIRCTSCHDPHREVEISTASYDAKCLSCHSPRAVPVSKASTHICRVAKKDCASCHMPKIELPGAHNRFTDHLIRIARANEKYPD